LPESQLILEQLIDDEVAYVQGFADDLQAATKAITLDNIRKRVGIWANQFSRLRNRAMLYFGGEKRLRWQEGDTIEKCGTCLGLDGQVRTAREWAALNIQPQDRQLECGGWNCECKFIVTNEPITNRPIPPMSKTHRHDDEELIPILLAFKGVDLKPTQAMADNARRALEIRDSKPKSQQGMTPVGLARANQLINRETLSPTTVRRMLSFFQRHEVDKQGSTWDEQGKGWQAWMGWGGDEGYSWARQRVGMLDGQD
jgi:hypothetical protein